MTLLTFNDMAQATGGQWVNRPEHDELRIAHVCLDSRQVRQASLFVAFVGAQVDGHDFVQAAFEQGAAAAMVSRAMPVPLPQLVVRDVTQALTEMAVWQRNRLNIRAFGITGSNGKTTVKTLLTAILNESNTAFANAGNQNNELGVPLSVLNVPEDAKYAVFEMGAGKPGDIEYLMDIAQPNIGLVNNIAAAHLERMGSKQGVADTKSAMYRCLAEDGVAVINVDDEYVDYFESTAGSRRIIRFGLEPTPEAMPDVYADQISLHSDASSFRLVAGDAEMMVNLPLPGRHNIANAVAAAAMAYSANVAPECMIHGLNGAPKVAGRQVSLMLSNGARIIDDTYNANPASMRAAIMRLTHESGRRILVMGDMGELGDNAVSLHADVGAFAQQCGLEALWTVGLLSKHAADAFGKQARCFDSAEILSAQLAGILESGDVCLVKGSRSSRMERVVHAVSQGIGVMNDVA